MNAIEVAERIGIDLSLIEESLRLTPEQRALQHQAALEMGSNLKRLSIRADQAVTELNRLLQQLRKRWDVTKTFL